MSKKFSYLSKMRDKEPKARFSRSCVDFSKSVRPTFAFPFFNHDDFISVTSVSEENTIEHYKGLVGFALGCAFFSFIEKKLLEDPENLLRLIEHFEQQNSNKKK